MKGRRWCLHDDRRHINWSLFLWRFLDILSLFIYWFFGENSPRIIVHDSKNWHKYDKKESHADFLMNSVEVFCGDIVLFEKLELVGLFILDSPFVAVFLRRLIEVRGDILFIFDTVFVPLREKIDHLVNRYWQFLFIMSNQQKIRINCQILVF